MTVSWPKVCGKVYLTKFDFLHISRQEWQFSCSIGTCLEAWEGEYVGFKFPLANDEFKHFPCLFVFFIILTLSAKSIFQRHFNLILVKFYVKVKNRSSWTWGHLAFSQIIITQVSRNQIWSIQHKSQGKQTHMNLWLVWIEKSCLKLKNVHTFENKDLSNLSLCVCLGLVQIYASLF